MALTLAKNWEFLIRDLTLLLGCFAPYGLGIQQTAKSTAF
jgi:hypothetical protein